MDKDYITGWEANYLRGRANRYPYDSVVSFILRRYSGVSPAQRGKIRILDLGCGGGNHLNFLLWEGFDFYGVDGSHASV